jgi:thiol:disulfide interchange protein DsbC
MTELPKLGRFSWGILIAVIPALLGGWVQSSAAEPASNPAALIKETIEKRYPGSHVMKVQPSPMPGVYEVYTGAEIVYSDARGDYLLAGPLIDTASRKDLTQERLNDFGRIDFHTLPFNRAIKVVKGSGSRQFAVFSDPDCPYCQQLEKTLLSVNDYTMYVFLYPIASLHPQAPSKAHAIWCAPDRSAAWNQWMHERKLPPAKTCAGDPVDALQKLGDELRINSTPTLFFADGRRVAGAIPASELEKNFATASAAVSAAPKASQAGGKSK